MMSTCMKTTPHTTRHDVDRRRRAPRGYKQSGMKSTDAEEPPAAINIPARCQQTPKSPSGYKYTGKMSTDAEELMQLLNNSVQHLQPCRY